MQNAWGWYKSARGMLNRYLVADSRISLRNTTYWIMQFEHAILRSRTPAHRPSKHSLLQYRAFSSEPRNYQLSGANNVSTMHNEMTLYACERELMRESWEPCSESDPDWVTACREFCGVHSWQNGTRWMYNSASCRSLATAGTPLMNLNSLLPKY